MDLSAGTRLGHYEVLAPLGAGGMGEVYRARDTKLNREVAIKVLPAALAQDADLLARFEREAKVLAALNHPNIAQVYGLEESNGVRALVMELVPGNTLKGPLPLETTLHYARQIAEALEAAHEKGITHRDLKPANIMVTPEGPSQESRVKVLDFGLAAVAEPPAAYEGNASQSPTLTMRATQAGMILGTASYMSPEQAAGQPVDRRADIWSFGVVLYEMLTGERLFTGESVAHTLAAVLHQEPDLAKVPAEVRPLLEKCLQKSPKKRLRAIGDWELLIQRNGAGPSAARAGKLPWVAAAAGLLIATGAIAWMFLHPAPLPEVVRFEIHAPEGSKLPLGTPAISNDGRMLAYTVTGPDGVTRIHVRAMDSAESRALPGTEGAAHPFWSPDGRSLAFAANGSLKRIDLAGGAPRVLTSMNGPYQGSWNQFGQIVFANLQTVPANGGGATPAVENAGFPHFLSDGKRVLMMAGDERNSVQLGSPGSKERKLVLENTVSAPLLAPTPDGQTYLLYLRDAALAAQKFDEAAGAVRGEPVMLVDNIGRVGQRGARATAGVSPSGILAYQKGGDDTVGARLRWYDRAGKILSDLPESAAGQEPRLSPDGRFAVVAKLSGNNNDVWVVNLASGSSAKLTFGPSDTEVAAWSPDGKRIAYGRMAGDKPGIYEKDATGEGQEHLLFPGRFNGDISWAPDGRSMLARSAANETVLLSRRDGARTIPLKPVMQAVFSPDGRYFAYSSAESGRSEIYVQAVPPATGKWQITASGGGHPAWRRDGKELYFLSPANQLTAVDVNLAGAFSAGTPRSLFSLSAAGFSVRRPYDVSADGQKFLVYTAGRDRSDAPITVVLNWWAALKKK